jgi:pimeloyl-ACP methyl ester carboxylesterase
LQNNNVNPSSSSSKSPYSLIDPNPSLIDENGNLVNDISKAATITTYRNGTIADGISKLILLVDYDNPLQFSINGTKPDDLTNGTLSSLNQSSNVKNLSSTTNVIPQNTSNRKSVVAAVYTPPDSFNNQYTGSNRIVNVNVSDPNNSASTHYELPIQLYRPPVVLIHGVWTNSYATWIESKFKEKLENKGYKDKVFLADYAAHNAKTFHPYAIPEIGNHGIDSLRKKIAEASNSCHNQSIAAGQVDVIAHSMGGLMARGFVQQPNYKRKENFMKGSIHRLITIGTPHFGGHLSEFVYHHLDDWYCIEGIHITPALNCKVEPKKLRTLYVNEGVVEALIPGSDAYSHLYQTNVKSYAIAGSWKPNANDSHESQEWNYQFITDNLGFNLDRDGFHDDNDLVVSIKSQLGGLPYQIRQPGSNDPPNEEDIPNKSAIYPNTVHASFLIKRDKDISSETYSPRIQEDIIILLNSSDNKFANAIGDGSPRHPSNIE